MGAVEVTSPREENDDKLTDLIDQASAQEMRETAIRVAEARAKAKRDQEPLPDGTYAITECVECGDEIGEARLKVATHNTMCVFCQSKAERWLRR